MITMLTGLLKGWWVPIIGVGAFVIIVGIGFMNYNRAIAGKEKAEAETAVYRGQVERQNASISEYESKSKAASARAKTALQDNRALINRLNLLIATNADHGTCPAGKAVAEIRETLQ